MRLIGVISTAVLSLTLGIAAPLYAQEQHEQQEEQKDKPAQQDEKRAQPEEKKAQPEKSAKPEEKAQQEKSAKPEERTTEQHTQETKTEQAHYNGRIPEDRFRANFGSVHVFVINRPVIVEGAPRFQYGGFWFGFGQPWPVGWAYTDNVYVDYVDGEYFLFNRVHPGVRISINVI
jgi:flagellar motor protein MotB